MVYCVNCGIKVEDEADFCPNCGTPMKEASSNQYSINQNHYPNLLVTKDSKNERILSIIGLILSIITIPLSLYYYAKDVAFAESWLSDSSQYMSLITAPYSSYYTGYGQTIILGMYRTIMNDLTKFAIGSVIFFISTILAFIGVYFFYKKKEANVIIFSIAGIINILIGLFFALFTRTIGDDVTPYYVGEFHTLGVISIVSAIIFILIAILSYKKKKELNFFINNRVR